MKWNASSAVSKSASLVLANSSPSQKRAMNRKNSRRVQDSARRSDVATSLARPVISSTTRFRTWPSSVTEYKWSGDVPLGTSELKTRLSTPPSGCALCSNSPLQNARSRSSKAEFSDTDRRRSCAHSRATFRKEIASGMSGQLAPRSSGTHGNCSITIAPRQLDEFVSSHDGEQARRLAHQLSPFREYVTLAYTKLLLSPMTLPERRLRALTCIFHGKSVGDSLQTGR